MTLAPPRPRVVRLYESSIPSGNAYKVSLMLAHLDQTVDVVELDIMATPSETRRPEFLSKNPNGRIPLVELEDGTYLAESNAILYYLAEGTAYLPEGTLERARALSWMFFEQYSHEPYVATLRFWTLWAGLADKRPEDIARMRERGQAALGVMATHLAAHDWFTGRAYGVADIALYAYSHAAASVGFDLQPLPAVRAWFDRVREQPGYVPIKADPTRR
jgi:glutathione S-transferase